MSDQFHRARFISPGSLRSAKIHTWSSIQEKETGTGHGISEDYAFEIIFWFETIIKPSDWLAQATLFLIENPYGSSSFLGIITNVNGPTRALQGYQYTIVFHSLLYPLKLRREPRIFIDKTPIEIIQTLLGSIPHNIQLENSFPILPCFVQHERSDWDSLMELTSEWGISFYWDVDPKLQTLKVVDNIIAFSNREILLHSELTDPKGELLSIWPMGKLETSELIWTDYDQKHPKVSQISRFFQQSLTPGHGSWHFHGKHIKIDQHLSRLESNLFGIDVFREAFWAECVRVDLNPGDVVTLFDHPEPHCNGSFLLIKIKHKSHNTNDYKNELLMIKADVPYRSCSAKTQKINSGMKTAIVDVFENSQVPLCNEEGKYRFQYSFDAEKLDEIRSPWTHLLQPFGAFGRETGFHFPLPAKSSISVHFMNGDIHYPIILGAQFNALFSDPITANVPTLHWLSSSQDHVFKISDDRLDPSLVLGTKNSTSYVRVSRKLENEVIQFYSEKGEFFLLTEQGSRWHSMQSLCVHSCSQFETIGVQDAWLQSEAEIHWVAGKSLFLFTHSECVLNVPEGEMILKSAERAMFEAKAIEVRSENNVSILSNQGALGVKAKSSIMLNAAKNSIQFMHSNASVIIDSTGITIKSGIKISCKAKKSYSVPNAQLAFLKSLKS